jgi:hypothetical protein
MFGLGHGDRVEGIQEQIHEALLKLNAVAEHAPRANGSIRTDILRIAASLLTMWTTSAISARTPIAVLRSMLALNITGRVE